MKKIVFAVLVVSLSSCVKKHCFVCTNQAGQVKAEKCFATKNKMFEYMQNEIGKPDSERCQ